MSEDQINRLGTRELRDAEFPEVLHQKIEKYIARIRDREDRVLTKPKALRELVDRATRHIKIPA